MSVIAVVLSSLAALAVVLTALGTWWVKAGRPRWRLVKRFIARLVETVDGRPAEEDAYGRETSPAIPPLAEQQATTQLQLGELTTAVQTLVRHGRELAVVRGDVADLQRRTTRLEQHTLERIAGHLDSAEAWRATQAAIAAEPRTDDDGEPSELDVPNQEA